MAHSYRLGLVTWRYQVLIPDGPDICHRDCAYTVLQTVQRPGVYSAAYGTVHYKEPLKSFDGTSMSPANCSRYNQSLSDLLHQWNAEEMTLSYAGPELAMPISQTAIY